MPADFHCATAGAPPKKHDRKHWSDLETFEAAKEFNPIIEKVQTIKDEGQGKLNTDYYAITIDSNDDSPEDFFVRLRENLNEMIFAGSLYSVQPYDEANAKQWSSRDPLGAVMSFTLARVPIVIPTPPPLPPIIHFVEEHGSVVLSCLTKVDFIFSTVVTEKDGVHPVAGNRAFGVQRNPDESLTVWTKATDRVVNGGVFKLLPDAMHELVFEGGHKVWVRFLDNIEEQFADRNPRNRIEYSKRQDY
jgi:hypothetical protein